MRIGELAAQVGVNPKTLRYYESIGLLPEPGRTASGYRDYTGRDSERVTFIKTAQRLGMHLDEIREVLALRDRGERPCGYVRRSLRHHVQDIDQRIADLHRLRDELITLDRLTDTDGPGCPLIEHSRAVHTGDAAS